MLIDKRLMQAIKMHYLLFAFRICFYYLLFIISIYYAITYIFMMNSQVV